MPLERLLMPGPQYSTIEVELIQLWHANKPNLAKWNRHSVDWLMDTYYAAGATSTQIQGTKVLYGTRCSFESGSLLLSDFEIAIGTFVAIAPGIVFLHAFPGGSFEKFGGIVRMNRGLKPDCSIGVVPEASGMLSLNVHTPAAPVTDIGIITISSGFGHTGGQTALAMPYEFWIALSRWLIRWLAVPADQAHAS